MKNRKLTRFLISAFAFCTVVCGMQVSAAAPLTGDKSNMKKWIVIFAVCAVALILCAIFTRKNRRR